MLLLTFVSVRSQMGSVYKTYIGMCIKLVQECVIDENGIIFYQLVEFHKPVLLYASGSLAITFTICLI